ncbi:hypothetical protein [Acinetobacter haemolyticus]|uniref:hypothetical protein n=1 Tax=Acinetobacter haemolyticus TaxID=29430 RepID=UPI000F739E7E|nr:hypothetical protein [Acinetobacter haemolyticus]RSN77891.1 hypothetical protein EA769_03470 [Acinetobacter haemolyticus]
MKKLILCGLIAVLVGCSNQNNQSIDAEHGDIEQSVSEVDLSSNEDITPEEAQAFATNLYQKIESDQQFLEDAFELKEYQTLSRYVLSDFSEYISTPHIYAPRAIGYMNKYFPDSDVLNPYNVCDTAFRDLSLYAGAMMHLAREDTAELRKILSQEKDDFLKSKAKCEHRINLTYKQAVDEYENE